MNVQLIPKEFWEERRQYREQASAPSATTPNSAISDVAAPQSYQPESAELAMYKDIGGQAAQSSEGNIAAMAPTAYRGVSKYVGRHGEQAYTNMGASSEQPSPSLMARTSSLASVSAPVARQPQTSMPNLAENPLRNQLIEEYQGIQQMIHTNQHAESRGKPSAQPAHRRVPRHPADDPGRHDNEHTRPSPHCGRAACVNGEG